MVERSILMREPPKMYHPVPGGVLSVEMTGILRSMAEAMAWMHEAVTRVEELQEHDNLSATDERER